MSSLKGLHNLLRYNLLSIRLILLYYASKIDMKIQITGGIKWTFYVISWRMIVRMWSRNTFYCFKSLMLSLELVMFLSSSVMCWLLSIQGNFWPLIDWFKSNDSEPTRGHWGVKGKSSNILNSWPKKSSLVCVSFF